MSIGVAVAAGVVSVASPCTMPLVPVYVGYLTGTAEGGRSRRAAVLHGLAFMVGFTVVFVALWACVVVVGYTLRSWVPVLRQIAGVLLVAMGLHLAGLVRIPLLDRTLQLPIRVPVAAGGVPGAGDPTPGQAPHARMRLGRAALLDVLLGAGWSPCMGPMLGGIVGLATVSGTAVEGTVLLLAYALGVGLPFLALAVGIGEVQRRLRWLTRHHRGVGLVSGGALVVVGLLMIAGLLTRLPSVLPLPGS